MQILVDRICFVHNVAVVRVHRNGLTMAGDIKMETNKEKIKPKRINSGALVPVLCGSAHLRRKDVRTKCSQWHPEKKI